MKKESEVSDDNELKKTYATIHKYMAVLANVETTLDNPMPLGQGEIC